MEKSENIQPPAEWAGCDGVKGTEKVYPASHLTMFIRVSVPFLKNKQKNVGIGRVLIFLLTLFIIRVVFGSRWNR